MGKEKVDILIVVDMQNDFVTGSLGTPEAQAIVPKVVEKIKGWKGEILYTQDTHYDNYLETQEGKHLPVKHCIEHTRGWLFVDEIEYDLLPEMKDSQTKIYEKRTFGSKLLMEDLYDSHFSTIGKMADFEINSITLIGLCTDICVISNALLLKAALPEVPIIVDASCCAGVTPESHKNALAAMKMCQIEIVNEEKMHYVNGDIILSANGAKRLQYLLRHPNVEEVQRKLKACNDALAEMNYRENEDGTTSFDIDIEV